MRLQHFVECAQTASSESLSHSGTIDSAVVTILITFVAVGVDLVVEARIEHDITEVVGHVECDREGHAGHASAYVGLILVVEADRVSLVIMEGGHGC